MRKRVVRCIPAFHKQEYKDLPLPTLSPVMGGFAEQYSENQWATKRSVS